MVNLTYIKLQPSLGMKIRALKTQACDLIVKQLDVAQRYNMGAIAVLRLYTYL